MFKQAFMRRIIIYLCIFFTVACSTSREATTGDSADTVAVAVETLDRSQLPVPGPAPEIRLGEYESFRLENGLTVYVVRNNKLPRVAYSLNIDRDPVYEGDKAGYVSIMGDLMSRGTSTRSKSDIDEAIDFIGATLYTSSTSLYGASLTRHSDQLLEIMQDVLLNPLFPQEELDKIVKQALSGLAADRDEPDVIARNIRDLVIYGTDHPFGEMLSEASLNNITREDIIDYYNKYWTPRSAYLAIVGDITVEEARKRAEAYFGSWEGSDIPQHEYDRPELPDQTTVILVDRPQSVQSAIRISYTVDYKTGDPDFFAARLMNQVLGVGFTSRLLHNLREDKGYTYTAGSSLSSNEVIGRFTAGASVRNAVTDSAISQFLYEMERMAQEGVTEEELKTEKAYLTGSYARSLESPQTIAGFAINTAIKNLPSNFYHDYLKSLDAVTLEEVNAAAKEYIRPDNCYIVVVGKAEEIEEKLMPFGPVIRYDVDGNIVDKGKLNAALESISPRTVIDRYLAAVGGAELMVAVENQKQTWELSAYGQAMKVHSVKTADGKFRTEVEVGGAVQQSLICNGEEVVTRAMGQVMPMDDKSKESEIINNRLFPELYYAESGVQLKLDGMEMVNGKDAYVLSVVYPSGKASQAYFDIESGLKVKEATTIDSPQGSFTQIAEYSDYREVDGILYAHIATMKMGPQQIETKLVSLENNTELAEDTFSLE
jgi:predicted Zn-dependent peptidase